MFSIFEFYFYSCKVLIFYDYLFGWEFMDLISVLFYIDMGFIGMSDSFINVSSSNSYILENIRLKMVIF